MRILRRGASRNSGSSCVNLKGLHSVTPAGPKALQLDYRSSSADFCTPSQHFYDVFISTNELVEVMGGKHWDSCSDDFIREIAQCIPQLAALVARSLKIAHADAQAEIEANSVVSAAA